MKKNSIDNNLCNDNNGDHCDPQLIFVWGFCLLISLLYLLIGTKSSPLYPFNDWVDANAFFTMGRGMMNGKIIYRDLFEQKGPLLYFIYGLASLVSAKTFIGVFLIEVFSFSIFLFFSCKSLILFMDTMSALISLPIITAFILNSISFSLGGSAEELCLPLFAFTLFHLLKLFKTDDSKLVTCRYFFWNGLVAGSILWIKFSMLGFWIGWLISVFLFMAVRKQYLNIIKGGCTFFLGLLLVTIPWVLYFGISHALPDWINTYFIINLSSYSGGTFFLSRLNVPLTNVAYQIYANPLFGGILWLGVIVFIVFGKFLISRTARASLLLCILFLILGIYGGELGYIYYYLIVTPLSIFGIIVLQDLIKDKLKKPLSAIPPVMLTLAIIIPTFIITLLINQNTDMLFVDKEELVQYKFAEIINKSDNPTLLNYGSLDMGFYTTTGIIPNIRFFESQNITASRFPLNIEEQNRYIKEKAVQFIVVQQFEGEYPAKLKVPFLYENYELISTENQTNEDRNYYYYLFEKVN